MELRNLTLKAVLAKLGEEHVKGVRSEIADALLDVLSPGDRKHATLADGTDVGTISVTQVKTKLVVTDERAFTAWVKEHRPHMIVETVRETDARALLDKALKDGEVLPGVEFTTTGGNLSVSVSEDQRKAIAAAYQAGSITVADLELPMGVTDDV